MCPSPIQDVPLRQVSGSDDFVMEVRPSTNCVHFGKWSRSQFGKVEEVRLTDEEVRFMMRIQDQGYNIRAKGVFKKDFVVENKNGKTVRSGSTMRSIVHEVMDKW